jgi:ATP-binding cassette subfamily B protein
MSRLPRLRSLTSQTARTVKLVWRSSRSGTLTLLALTLLAALLPLAVAWVGKAIIDAVVEGARSEALTLVFVELGLVIALATTQRGLTLLRSLLGARLSVDIHVAILEKALSLEMTHFEDPEFYDRLTRARREASSRPVSLVTGVFSLMQNALTLIGYVALLVAFSALAVVGLFVAAIPATIAELRYSNEAFRLRNWRAPDTRKLNYLEYVLANDAYAKEVRLFGLGPLLLGRFRSLAELFYREDRSLAWRRATRGHALSLIGTLAFYGCYAVIALATVAGRLTLGTMTLYVVAFRQGQQAFQAVLAAIGTLWEDSLYMSNLFEFLAIPVAPLPVQPVGQAPAAPDGSGIRFENVGFRYPDQERWALRGITLTIPAGQSLALVGHNGAGKTTFIKLLTRLYDPTEGRVLLDGVDLRAWDPERLRRRIAVIFQDFSRYQLELRENVGFGSVDDLDDLPRIIRAVESGGATADVAGLPQGLATILGRSFHGGTELSGGQWQKVAIARAFMREQADILVLDEPTAALDALAEHAVFERFSTLTRGRTCILISHRFPTVRMADRIVVLESGRVVEEGTHEELVAQGERYAQLFALQAKGYL